MKRLAIFLLLAVSSLGAQVCSPSPCTVTPNEGTTVQPSSKVKRASQNMGDTFWYGNGNIYKSVIGVNNPNGETLEDLRSWALVQNGTTTSFTSPINFDNYPANYFVGAKFFIVAVQTPGSPEMGCTGTITANTGPNWPGGGGTSPVFTTTACPGPFLIGDVVMVQLNTDASIPTTETAWESDFNGVHSQVSGGGKLLSETTNLCATCGHQALRFDASAGGSFSGIQFNWDSDTMNAWRIIGGTWTLSFDAKLISGTPSLSISANRSLSGGLGFNCPFTPPTLTTSWAHYTLTCTGTETAGQTPQISQVSFGTGGGAIVVADNWDFRQTSGTDSTNTTVFSDQFVANLRKAHPATLRMWITQQGGISIDNWTSPDYARGMSNTQTQAYGQPALNGQLMPSLEDYLQLCQLIGADPYLVMPTPWTPADAKNLIDFLAGDNTTTYGARRIALGQTAPWTSVFNVIHLEYGNENWNVSFSGEALFFRGNAPSGPNSNGLYFDYMHADYGINGAIRGDAFYTPSKFDLIANAQTAQTFGMDTFIAAAPVGSAPDSLEIQGYYGNTINQFATDAQIWGALWAIPWDRIVDSNDPANFYQSVHFYQGLHTCGAAGTSTCGVNIYEWGQGTINGSLPQNTQDSVNAGGGTVVDTLLIPLLNMQYYGLGPQNLFADTEYDNGGSNANTAKLWGTFIDAGGATNNVRPVQQALQLMNASIMGTMYSCPLSGTFTTNYAGNVNNGDNVPPGTPAINNLPYIYAFCFMNGSQRSMILVNADLSSHAVTLAGAQAPSGTVTTRQLAPSSPDVINEAHSGSPTNTATQQTSITTSSGAATSTITLPAGSGTALDWTSGSTLVAATPTFSPAAGTYGSAQSVTVSTTSSGAILCGNTTNSPAPATNGTTGCVSGSTLYTGPVSVATSETLYYVAGGTGFLDSSVGSAAYTINTPSSSNVTLGGSVSLSGSVVIN